MTKEQRTVKEQATQITELINKIKELKSNLELTRGYKERYGTELADIHATFDLLGVPRRANGTCHALKANARLTLFIAQINGIKVTQPKEGE